MRFPAVLLVCSLRSAETIQRLLPPRTSRGGLLQHPRLRFIRDEGSRRVEWMAMDLRDRKEALSGLEQS